MNIENEEALICEAIVREIGLATRWSAIYEAWHALLHVRLMAKQMKEELNRLKGPATIQKSS